MKVMTMTAWAKETGLKVSTLRRAIRYGHLPARRLGAGPTSPYYIIDRDLEQWLSNRRVAAESAS